jgi:peptide-methionine (S)-S-oxide reductase
MATPGSTSAKTGTATLGGGCFWCLEAVFQQIPGVARVVSGYAGGATPDPTYQEVCGGGTGHAEVVQIEYDPSVVGFGELLDVFWKAHDPTTLNHQGHDVGTQYRSVILYESDEQRAAAEQSRDALERSGVLGRPVVTQISRLERFYPAEAYHQDYYRQNRQAPYCQAVIRPKLRKLDLAE